MIVSWNWLQEYLRLDMPLAEFERRMMMAGFNHESTHGVGGDVAIDLEITSNRPDCLGHLGLAREAAVLFERTMTPPNVDSPSAPGPGVPELTRVTVNCPELCPRYTARVVRGVKVGPSPAWLRERLTTIGIAPINNVVDITNYVLMECGQPLHAFDLAKLAGPEIIVREGRPGEQIEAINHRAYEVGPGVCVIADARRPVAIGGVMGGAATEVTAATRDVLIEAAEFDPRSIRATARRLNLHSDSSYRFERGLDPAGVDWASRRACRLLVELAGGELAAGVLDVGDLPAPRSPVVLRLAQLPRILGVAIDPARIRQILAALGNEIQSFDKERVEVIPPSWRRDLTREIDLIEEVARIHGYDAIPEDVRVPMAASSLGDRERVLAKVRHVLTAAGCDEALTVSTVEEDLSAAFSPWTDAAPLCTLTPVLRRASHLRRSLVPSLLSARRTNESLANPRIELFEIARAYLPRAGQLPSEEPMLALTSGGDFAHLKGIVEAVLAEVNPAARFDVAPVQHELFGPGRGCELRLDGAVVGYLGEVSRAGLERFDLRGATSVAEIKLGPLHEIARLVPRFAPLPTQPAVTRDVNLVVAESVRWVDLRRVVEASGGPRLESLAYQDTYRDPERLGVGKKSLLFTLTLRDAEVTLTSEQADEIRDRIVAACGRELAAQLRA